MKESEYGPYIRQISKSLSHLCQTHRTTAVVTKCLLYHQVDRVQAPIALPLRVRAMQVTLLPLGFGFRFRLNVRPPCVQELAHGRDMLGADWSRTVHKRLLVGRFAKGLRRMDVLAVPPLSSAVPLVVLGDAATLLPPVPPPPPRVATAAPHTPLLVPNECVLARMENASVRIAEISFADDGMRVSDLADPPL